MKLMQNSGVPIYQQIADSFKTDILAGRYEQGEFLPSIRGLAKDLKISVITTMKAYEQLADEGLITAAQGKGFYVNAQDSEMIKEQHLRKVEESLTDAEVEQIKGLALLHDVDTEELIKKAEETDKTGWTGDTFADLCGRYWDKLKEIEKEIISNAMDDGLNEEQMINIFLAPTDDMDNLRRAYVIDNKRNGDDR